MIWFYEPIIYHQYIYLIYQYVYQYYINNNWYYIITDILRLKKEVGSSIPKKLQDNNPKECLECSGV